MNLGDTCLVRRAIGDIGNKCLEKAYKVHFDECHCSCEALLETKQVNFGLAVLRLVGKTVREIKHELCGGLHVSAKT